MKRKLLSSIMLAFGFLLVFFVKDSFAATLYWVGTDGSNASVAASWSTTNPTSCSLNVTPSGAIPGSADQMNFDADCDNGATIDSSFSSIVTSIVLSSGYGGTVTLSNPLSTSSTMAVTGGIFTGTSQLTVGATLTVNGGVANFGSFSAFTQTGNVTLSSGTLTLPDGADLNGTSTTVALDISGGTFNAPSGNMTLASGFRVQNSPIFNANGGTFTLDGTSGTLACGNVTFSTVVIANTGSTKTINSDCTLPLGENPTITTNGSLSLSGILNGSGTFSTTGSGGITGVAGSVFSGFSAFNLTKTFTVAGASVDLSSSTSFTTSGTFAVSSGSFISPSSSMSTISETLSGGTVTCTSGATWTATGTMTFSGATADIGNCNASFVNLTLSSGSFTAPGSGKTFTVSSTMAFSSTGDYIPNGGTLTFNGTSNGTIACNSESFNLVAFTHTASATKTISTDCTLPVGNNPIVTGRIRLNSATATISGTGTFTSTETASNALRVTAGTFTGFSGLVVYGQVGVDGGTLDLTNYDFVIVYGENTSSSISVSDGGTLTAPTNTMVLSDSLNNDGTGTFNHSNGTIVLKSLAGVDAQVSINSNWNLYNLTWETTEPSRLTFDGENTVTISGNLILNGKNGLLTVESLTSGVIYNLDARGGRVLQNLSVQDSNNINSNTMVCSNCSDQGNNTNWTFSNYPISFFLDYPGGESHITDTNPVFRWKKATASVNASITKYVMFVDNGDSVDFSIDNILPSISDPHKEIRYLTYTLWDKGDYLELRTISPFGMLTLGKKNWRVVAYDSAGNVQEESVDFYVDGVSTPVAQIVQLALAPRITTPIVSEPVQGQEPMPVPTPIPEPRLPVPSQDTFLERILKWILEFLKRILEFLKNIFS